jgi:hypothetical protein
MAAVRVTIEIHYRWNFIQKMRDMQIDRPRQIQCRRPQRSVLNFDEPGLDGTAGVLGNVPCSDPIMSAVQLNENGVVTNGSGCVW